MPLQYTLYFAILSCTALLSAVVGLAAWRRRARSPASKPFVAMMAAITGYALIAALESAAIGLQSKIFWSTLEYVGSGSVITLFLIFALHFTQHQRWLTRRNTLSLWIMPCLNVLLVATNAAHRLVWTGFLSDPSGTLVIYQHGPGFFWVMVWVYVYVLIGSLLLVKAALRPSVLYRRQSRLVLAGATVPLLGGSAYMLNLTPPGLNITPMSFMITGVIYFISLFRSRLFDLVPVARDFLIEHMSDGVLVLDLCNRIVDMNPAAQRLTKTTVACVGRSVEQVLSRWPHIAQLWQEDESLKTEILMDAAAPTYVELKVTPLYDRRHRLTGRLLVLRDITQRHQAEVELRQVNERLQQQLVEIEVLQTQLREQAIRDKLTGLFNRRYFEETFPRELLRAGREGYAIAVILMDIDFFKKINDTFGHQGGDRVLQAFGELLRRYSRSTDIACRYGGEEFVLALPGMNLECAYQRIEEIRLSFQMTQVKSNADKISATISSGVAMFPDHGASSEELLKVADLALYAAKAAGRNCIKLGAAVQNPVPHSA